MLWSDSEDTSDEYERTKSRKCTYCGLTLKHIFEVPLHESKCILRNEKYSKMKYKNHIEKFICDICCAGYKFLYKLKEHIRKHEPPGGFYCVYCDTNFCNKYSLTQHMENTHSIFNCSFCNDIFQSESDIIIHKREFHAETKKCVICQYCFQPFKTHYHLEYHIKMNCGPNKKFKCINCDESYQTSSELKLHEINHFKSKEKDIYQINSINSNNKDPRKRTNKLKKNNNKKQKEETTLRKSLRIKKEIQYDESIDQQDALLMNDLVNNLNVEEIKVEPEISQDSDINLFSNNLLKEKLDDILISNDSEIDSIKNEESDDDSNNDCSTENSLTSESTNSETDIKNEYSSDIRKKNINSRENTYDNLPKESFECIFCSNSLNKYHKLESYTGHLRKEHKKTNEEVVEILKQINSIQSELFCKVCGRYYKTLRTLDKHIKRHGPNGNLTIYCTCCKEYLPSSTNIEDHMIENHIDRVKCKICDKQYKNYESLHMHVQNTHKKKRQQRPKKTFMCNKCGKCVSSKRQLEDHESSDCGKNPIYQCKVCGKCLTTAGILKQHLRTHSNDNLHHCKFCNKGFAAKGNLDRHERSHTGERPYACTYCDKAFAYQENLFIHLSTHTGMKRYMCVTCSERFSCISGLKCHWKTNANTCGADPNRSTKAVGEYIGFRKGKIVHERE